MVSRLVKLPAILSQLLGVILFDNHPDETISARCYRQGELEGHCGWQLARKIIDCICSPFQANHCMEAFIKDVNRSREYSNYLRVYVNA